MWERTPIELSGASPAAVVPYYTGTANADTGEGNATPEFDFNGLTSSQQSGSDWPTAPPSAYSPEAQDLCISVKGKTHVHEVPTAGHGTHTQFDVP